MPLSQLADRLFSTGYHISMHFMVMKCHQKVIEQCRYLSLAIMKVTYLVVKELLTFILADKLEGLSGLLKKVATVEVSECEWLMLE